MGQEADQYLLEVGLAKQQADGMIKHLDQPAEFFDFLNMRPDELVHTTEEVIVKGMHILSAYLIYFRSEYNRRWDDHRRIQITFEQKLCIETIQLAGTKVTKEERRARVIEQSAVLQQMQKKLLEAESRAQLLEGFADDVKEKLNVFKKVYDDKYEERRLNRKQY